MSFIDKFLDAMKLKDDEPDLLIESTIGHTVLGNRDDSVLRLSVRTDLSLYSKSERYDYCLQRHLTNDRIQENDFLLSSVTGSTTDELDKFKDYLTSDQPFLGLVGITIYHGRTILRFTVIDNPKVEYLYRLEHRRGISITIEKPLEANDFYDPRFGAYDRLQLITFSHQESATNVLDTTLLQRSLGPEVVFKEILQPIPNSKYFLINTTYYSRTF